LRRQPRSGKGPWKEHAIYHLVLDYDAMRGLETGHSRLF